MKVQWSCTCAILSSGDRGLIDSFHSINDVEDRARIIQILATDMYETDPST